MYVHFSQSGGHPQRSGVMDELAEVTQRNPSARQAWPEASPSPSTTMETGQALTHAPLCSLKLLRQLMQTRTELHRAQFAEHEHDVFVSRFRPRLQREHLFSSKRLTPARLAAHEEAYGLPSQPHTVGMDCAHSLRATHWPGSEQLPVGRLRGEAMQPLTDSYLVTDSKSGVKSSTL